MEASMAGFSLKDVTNVKGEEEDQLKELIWEGWQMIKKINWDDRDYCVFNPKKKVMYPVGKSYQKFMENEGWKVSINEISKNLKFTIYKD
jgi:hypothetical protein